MPDFDTFVPGPGGFQPGPGGGVSFNPLEAAASSGGGGGNSSGGGLLLLFIGGPSSASSGEGLGAGFFPFWLHWL